MPAHRRSPVLRCLGVAAAIALPLVAVPSSADAADGDTVVGELVQAWPEDVDADEGAAPALPLSWVEPARGEAVRVATEDLPDVAGLAPGATVEVVVGGQVLDEPSNAGLEPARDLIDVQVLEAAPATTAAVAGVHPVTVVLVRPGGMADDGTALQDVVDMVTGPVADFWSEQSGGAVQLEVEARHDWLSTTATCANPELLFPEVDRAVGWAGVEGDRRHLLLYLPPSPDCPDGLATVGYGVPDGGYLYTEYLLPSIVAHEFGHNLSLGHASLMHCDGTVDAGDCGVYEYLDLYDVMGASWDQLGTLNGPHAARLGFLPSDRMQTVRTAGAGGTYTLAPVSAATGLRAVRIISADGSVYWLEYRAAEGRDAWLGTADNTEGLEQGLLVRLAQDGDDTSLLLDSTPSPTAGWATDYEYALTSPGQQAVLAEGDLVVRLEALTPTGAQVRVSTPIEIRYADTTVAAALGSPTGPQVCGLRDGGCAQGYADGTMYWSPLTGARYVSALLAGRYASAGPAGPLGYPTGDTQCSSGDVCTQRFQGGWLTATSPTNVRAVWGAIARAWTAAGGSGGPVGYPVSDERCGLRDGGCHQRFQNGTMYWTRATGARLIEPLMMASYRAVRYETGPLRYPTTDLRCGLRDGGCAQRFQGGWIYRMEPGYAHAVFGGIGARYAGTGFELGPLGYPAGDEYCIPGVCAQAFDRAEIAWSREAGAKIVRGAIRGAWWPDQLGNGYPVTEERCGLVRSGCFQRFRTGSIYWSPATGARRVGLHSREIARVWAAQGYERGRLGYPVSHERIDTGRGLVTQSFQGGTLVLDTGTGRVRRI